MESNKIDLFIITNSKYFAQEDLNQIRNFLKTLPDDHFFLIEGLQFRDPVIVLIVSLIGGGLGIDRFLIGDTFLGILKLITFGGLGVWTIIDWFLIMKATRKKNYQKLQKKLFEIKSSDGKKFV